MEDYQSKIVSNILCDQVIGELDVVLANKWLEKLEEQELKAEFALHRCHDVRSINAVHLSFDDLWAIAQRRLKYYESGGETLTVFWVSTPLNYGVARMYQALTDGTPFKIEVLYKLEEVADFLGVDQSLIENVNY